MHKSPKLNQKSPKNTDSAQSKSQPPLLRNGEKEAQFLSGMDQFPSSGHLPASAIRSKSGIIQPKLKIGAQDDSFEREADSVAEQVMSRVGQESQPIVKGKAPSKVQRKCADCDAEEEAVQMKPLSVSNKLSGGGEGGKQVNAQMDAKIHSARGMGSTLGRNTLSKMNQGFGHDFSGVRIHTDSNAAQLSGQLGAKAFTVGQDIFFGQGQFQPHTFGGQQLLAHELTHTIQQGGTNRIQRSPDLTIPDYEIADLEVADVDDSFQWENKSLLDTVFNSTESEGNDRLLALRSFLQIQKELEIEAKVPELKEGMSPEEVEAAVAEHETETLAALEEARKAIVKEKQEKADLEAELAKETTAKKELDKQLRAVFKDNKRAAELRGIRTKIQERIDKAKKSVANADGNINYLKLKKKYVDPSDPAAVVSKDQKYWDDRRMGAVGKLDEANTEMAATDEEYDGFVGTISKDIEANIAKTASLKEGIAAAKGRLAGATTKEEEALATLKVIERLKTGKTDSLKLFKRKLYHSQLEKMNHGELMEEILALFEEDDRKADSDPTYQKRFPDWQRYAVIHYSGMRYANAHGTWFDPSKILTFLKKDEIASMSTEERKFQQAEIAETDLSILEEEGVNSKTRKAIKNNSGATVRKGLKKADGPLYDIVMEMEKGRNLAIIQLQQAGSDPAKADELRQQIDDFTNQIEENIDKMTSGGKSKVRKAMAAKVAALDAAIEQRALHKIKELGTGQMFAVLNLMHDNGQMPDVVWRELQAFTEGRVSTTEEAWDANLRMKDAKGATPEEEALIQKWAQVLKDSGFYSNTTGWREHHSASLSPSIVSSLMCDQLGSNLQHMRGLKRKGGLRENANYYRQQAEGGAADTYFKLPADVSDLKPGASLYWFGWTGNTPTAEWSKHEKNVETHEARVKRLKKDYEGKKEITEAKDKKDPSKFMHKESKRKTAAADMLKLEGKISEAEGKLESAKGEGGGLTKYNLAKDKLPDISQIISPETFAGGGIQVGKLSFKQDFKDDDGWTYRALEQDIPVAKDATRRAMVLMRVKPNPDVYAETDNPPLDWSYKKSTDMLKQYMRWTHEATIMYADDKHTVTFDTSGSFTAPGTYNKKSISGMSARQRSTPEILTEDNVFVGYAPGLVDNVDASRFLDIDTSGMSAEAYDMMD